jgi:DeoR/GlpR family transcriptional regulator of sugar metabolism
MKASERHRAILDLVRIGDANVEQLSAALGVSEATVRRDLTMLAKQRHLVRTYGGATAVVGVHEPEASGNRKMPSPKRRRRMSRTATPSCSTAAPPVPRWPITCARDKTCTWSPTTCWQ